MENFKLLQIVPSMESGGVEQGTLDLSNHLTKNNFTNFIASSGGKMLNSIENANTKLIKLPINSKNFITYPFLAKKLQNKIDEFGINVVHFRSRAPAWLLPFLKKNFLSVSTFHNVYGNQNYFKSFYNTQLANVDSIVAISEYVKNEIIKNYSLNEKKITVINRGCDTNFFDPEKLSNKEINEFALNNQIPTNKKIILFPGRLTSWKGQIEFLEIIKQLKNRDLYFIFVGDGKNISYKKKLLDKIKSYELQSLCLLIDHLNQKDLRVMYHLSSIVVSAPLKPEGFGRIVNESLSMKKMVLAYNYGGVKDQLSSLNNIYKIDPKNHKMFIEKINLVCNFNSQEYDNLANVSRLNVIKFFSKEKMLNQYMNLYLSL